MGALAAVGSSGSGIVVRLFGIESAAIGRFATTIGVVANGDGTRRPAHRTAHPLVPSG